MEFRGAVRGSFADPHLYSQVQQPGGTGRLGSNLISARCAGPTSGPTQRSRPRRRGGRSMRKALNENPMVQLAVLGVGAILLAVIAVDARSEAAAASEPRPTTPDPAPAPRRAAQPRCARAGARSRGRSRRRPPRRRAAPAPATPAAAGATRAPPTGCCRAQGLPKDLLVAYAKNKAIALLVIDPKGISDRQPSSRTPRRSSSATTSRSSSSRPRTSPTTPGSPRASRSAGPRRWS